MKAADKIPRGARKGTYCTEGLAQGDPQFRNGQRIIDLAAQEGHASDYIAPLSDAMAAAERAYAAAQRIQQALAQHKAMEDEVKDLKATIKAIEAKRDELVQSARAKISVDEARTLIIKRLRLTLLAIYQSYVRSEQRACIKTVENLWSKYAVTAKTIEAERDAASRELHNFLVELGYE